MSGETTKGRLICLVAAVCIAAGCAGVSGPYVWVDDYPAPRSEATGYTIAPGDLLNVQVWNQDKISTRTRVRSDGSISIPLLGDVDAVGKTPRVLGKELERRLGDADLVVNPRVSIAVDEIKPLSVSIVGAVARPGTYSFEPGTGLAAALASAGGLTDFAHKDRVFVVRQAPTPVRIRFTFGALTGAVGGAPLFKLKTNDLVVVE